MVQCQNEGNVSITALAVITPHSDSDEMKLKEELAEGQGWSLARTHSLQSQKGWEVPQQVDPALGYRQQGELRGRESRSCLSRAQGD